MKNKGYVILFGSFVGALTAIIVAVRKVVTKTVNKILSPIANSIKDMDTRQCRMWLVDFLCDIENGELKDEVQFKFAHEVYDHYTNELHENSYVHDKWERVMA